jgi:hypothetical protein
MNSELLNELHDINFDVKNEHLETLVSLCQACVHFYKFYSSHNVPTSISLEKQSDEDSKFLKEVVDNYTTSILQGVVQVLTPVEDQVSVDTIEAKVDIKIEDQVSIQSSGSDADFVVINTTKSPQSSHNELVTIDDTPNSTTQTKNLELEGATHVVIRHTEGEEDINDLVFTGVTGKEHLSEVNMNGDDQPEIRERDYPKYICGETGVTGKEHLSEVNNTNGDDQPEIRERDYPKYLCRETGVTGNTGNTDNTEASKKKEIKYISPKVIENIEVVPKKSDPVKRITTTRRSGSREPKTLVPEKVDDSNLSSVTESVNISPKVQEPVPEKEKRISTRRPVSRDITKTVIKLQSKDDEPAVSKVVKSESPKEESPKKLIEVKIQESESESDSDIERDFTDKIPGKGRIRKVVNSEPETKVVRKTPIKVEPEPQAASQERKTTRRVVRAKKQ